MRQIVLDTETTGLNFTDGHRVIEIGCVEMINRRLTGRNFHYYVNPEHEVEREALEVHGIDNDFLQDKPFFVDIAKEFCDFIDGAEIIAHNASFDVGFLNHELKLAKLGLGKITDYCTVFDTLSLARQLHPGQRNNLDALTKRYNITHFNRNLHGALLDAEILAQVYLAMTGGQTALFSEEAQQTPENVMIRVERSNSMQKSLIVLKANQQELAAHQKMQRLLNETTASV
ncbi:MAG: DNA polymerase III subunit epsilon [Gammaproteobacteria bacterium]|jgi:DNA polymerase-3 subunit epsilon